MPARRTGDWERNLGRLERQLPAPLRRMLRQLEKRVEPGRKTRRARPRKRRTRATV